jgi:group I intron endonuclease
MSGYFFCWWIMSDDKLTGVYQIRNLVNGKIYVGSTTKSFRSRWADHRTAMLRGDHRNPKLQNAWNKYGPSCFVFEILVACPRELCIHFEQIVMDRLLAFSEGYNLLPVAGSSLGLKHSEETKAKLSKLKKGTKHSPETNAKIAAAQTGKKRSHETCEKIRALKLGVKRSPETCVKIGIASASRRHSDTTRAKMKASRQAYLDRKRAESNE